MRPKGAFDFGPPPVPGGYAVDFQPRGDPGRAASVNSGLLSGINAHRIRRFNRPRCGQNPPDLLGPIPAHRHCRSPRLQVLLLPGGPNP